MQCREPVNYLVRFIYYTFDEVAVNMYYYREFKNMQFKNCRYIAILCKLAISANSKLISNLYFFTEQFAFAIYFSKDLILSINLQVLYIET